MGKLKEQILGFLKLQDDFVSGEEISKGLDVTRASVWKNIKKLQEEGYEIEAITKKGYKLVGIPNVITKEELLSILNCDFMGQSIQYYDTLESTNQKAKEWARDHAEDGSIVIADCQTKGKGRLGRGWVSPKGTGIFMSVILRPDMLPTKTYQLTLLAGMAICEGIRAETGLDAKIKWPNDIVIGGKKVCGILVEMSAEVQCVHYVIVGVGVNVNMLEFDESIPYATSLAVEGNQEYIRKDIIKSFLEHFEKIYKEYSRTMSLEGLLPHYKRLCVTLGKEVKITKKDKDYRAYAKDISEDGQLLVVFEDGREEEVLAGEVSVRGLYGYV